MNRAIYGYMALSKELLALTVRDFRNGDEKSRAQILRDLKNGNLDIYFELLGISRDDFTKKLKQIGKEEL